jgi:hypothetical protein
MHPNHPIRSPWGPVLTVSACLLGTSLAAVAQTMEEGAYQTVPSFDTRWYISPFAAYTWADEDRGTDDGAGWGFAVGKPINEWLNLELRMTYTNRTSTNPADLSRSELEDRLNTDARLGFSLAMAISRSATSPSTGSSSSTAAPSSPSCSPVWAPSTTTSAAIGPT